MDTYAYMRAYLRLMAKEPKGVAGLSDEEVLQSFLLLPIPAVAYPDWLAAMQLIVTSAENAPLDPGLTTPSHRGSKEDLKELFNDPCLSGIVTTDHEEFKA